jgi:hypothetical protein
MMNSTIWIIEILKVIGCFVLVGCSSPKPGSYEAMKEDRLEVKKEMVKTLEAAPSWYTKPPKATDILYEKASAKSGDMQMAINKATTLARAQLALSIQNEINATMKLYADDLGQEASVVTSQDAILANLTGVQEEDTKIVIEGDKYVAYVLIRYPIGEFNKLLTQKLNTNANVKTKLRAKKAFDDLEKKIEEARLRKEQE